MFNFFWLLFCSKSWWWFQKETAECMHPFPQKNWNLQIIAEIKENHCCAAPTTWALYHYSQSGAILDNVRKLLLPRSLFKMSWGGFWNNFGDIFFLFEVCETAFANKVILLFQLKLKKHEMSKYRSSNWLQWETLLKEGVSKKSHTFTTLPSQHLHFSHQIIFFVETTACMDFYPFFKKEKTRNVNNLYQDDRFLYSAAKKRG